MWTVNITNQDGGLADVSAIFTDPKTNFAWNSRIKIGEIDIFVSTAKAQLTKYQTIHQNDDTLKASIETALNN